MSYHEWLHQFFRAGLHFVLPHPMMRHCQVIRKWSPSSSLGTPTLGVGFCQSRTPTPHSSWEVDAEVVRWSRDWIARRPTIKNAAGLVHSKVNSTVIVSIKHNVILQSCCCLLTGPNPEPENPEAGAEAEGVGDEEGEEEEEADPDPTIDPDSKDRK